MTCTAAVDRGTGRTIAGPSARAGGLDEARRGPWSPGARSDSASKMRTRSRIGDLLVEQRLQHPLHLAEAELGRGELLDDDRVAALDDVGERP